MRRSISFHAGRDRETKKDPGSSDERRHTLEFSLVGVVASLVGPLAAASVSVFVLSTYDTDYLLVKQADLRRAIDALQKHGHSIGPPYDSSALPPDNPGLVS